MIPSFPVPPFSVWDCWWLAPLALLLDLWLGDPDLPWRHPVCLQGSLLHALEGPARRFMDTGGMAAAPWRGRLAGGLALTVLTGLTGLAVWGLTSLPLLGNLLALYLAWSGLALGSLLRTGREVLQRVETAPEPEARAAVGPDRAAYGYAGTGRGALRSAATALGRALAGMATDGAAGGGHAQPQFGLVHDGLRLALLGAHGRTFGLFRGSGGQALAGAAP